MSEQMATAAIELKIDGDPVSVQITVPAGPTPPSRLLPVFRSLAEAIVGIGMEDSVNEGARISCSKGCGACCRQLVPMTPTEAVAMRAYLDRLPEERRLEIDGRFARARERLAEAGLLDRLISMEPFEPGTAEPFGVEYFRLGIACPFLEDESCSIYEERPIACREYLVTSDPVHCATPSKETVRVVRVPSRVSIALSRLDAAPGPARRAWVPLVLAPEWGRDHPEETPARTGPQLLELLVRILSETGPCG